MFGGDDPGTDDSAADNDQDAGDPNRPTVKGSGDEPGKTAVDASNPVIDVKGKVVDLSKAPMPGGHILIVDASGGEFSATTDAAGRFAVQHVVPPYDLRFDAAPSVTFAERTMYLGLTLSEVSLESWYYSNRPVAQSGTVNVQLQLPTCAVGQCVAMVATYSTRGSGFDSVGWKAGTTAPTAIAVTHTWNTASAADIASEPVDVVVFMQDGASNFAYANPAGAAPLAPGGTLNVGKVEVSPVSRFGPATFTMQTPGVPSDWRRDIDVWLVLRGFPFPFQRVNSESLVTYLPNIPGGTINVQGLAVAPDGPDDSLPVIRDTRALANQLPLSTTNVLLPVAKAPDTVRPTPNGTLSRASEGFEWEPVASSIYRFGFNRRTTGAVQNAVYLTDNKVTFARLARLGASLEDGDNVFELASVSGTSVEPLVEADATKAKAFFDTPQYSSSTFTYTVTP